MARVEQLFSERALTGSLLDETRSKRLAAESAREEIVAQARTAEAAIQSAQALIDKAQADTAAVSALVKVVQLDARRVEALKAYTVISAPCAGVVTQRSIDVGDLTQPGTQGVPMFTITRDDPVTDCRERARDRCRRGPTGPPRLGPNPSIIRQGIRVSGRPYVLESRSSQPHAPHRD